MYIVSEIHWINQGYIPTISVNLICIALVFFQLFSKRVFFFSLSPFFTNQRDLGMFPLGHSLL